MSRSPQANQQQIDTLTNLLHYRAATQPDQKAYTYLENGETDTSVITFATLDQRAHSIAAHLQQCMPQGARALLLYPSGLDFITAFFGCLYAGIVAIPMNLPRPNRPLTRLNAIVADAQATHILTTTTIQHTIHSACMNMPGMRELDWICTDNVTTESGNWQQPQLTGDTLAYLQYTSGSTATPKGVMVSHANLLQNMAILDHGWNHTPSSTLISWLPLFHDMGLIYGVLQPLYNGIPCVLLSPVHFLQKPVRWLQAITRFQGTHSAAPNFAYDLCVNKISPEQRQTLNLRSWRVALNGAEPVRKATLERFTEIFAPYGFQDRTLCPGYGLAEGTLKVAATPEQEPFMFCTIEAAALEQNKIVEASGDYTYTLVSSGRTALDTNVVIVHPQHQTRCAADEVGEIWVSGSSVAQGYWQRPTETAETFQAYLRDTGEGPFLRTGDLGFLRHDHVFVTGRLKDVIIIRGRNHYPQDIEHTTESSHIAIRPGCSAAFSIDHDGIEELVIVCEIEREHRRANLTDVVENILQTVSAQHELNVYAIVLIRPGTIPKTSSGKIQRRACHTQFSEDAFQVLHRWSQTDVQDTYAILTDDKPLPSVTQHPDRATIQNWLVERFAAHLHRQPTAIDPHASIDQLRLNSLTAINIIGELGDWLGRDLSPTLLYNYQTIAALAHHLTQDRPHHHPQTQASEKQPHNEPIAIVGLGGRFPGAENIEVFWNLLIHGSNAIREVPAQRWNADHFYDPTPATKGRMNTRWGGFLDHIDTFDASFFGISPREAASMDPQQRILLEVAWEALEHGGLAPEQLAGTSTGVFVGISTNEYQRMQFNHPDHIDAYAGTGTALSITANRLSYLLNLNGPSMAVDTACSSSLVAVHLACQSLRQGECNTALAGGSNVILGPETSIALAQAQMLSPSGQCKTFDANANGYVRGEGCGIVVLKRLSDARAAKDRVLAVIRGSAINQDGRSNGLSAPNGMAQQAVIRQALQTAQVKPTDISYVETHGTGTSLGDPIEVEALVHVLQEQRSSDKPCVFGSVKTNIGHLEAGAGIAGLIKTVLAIWHGTIPPHLHLEKLNPYIRFEEKPFLINTQPYEWPRNGQPRYAGISSFGFGGTNAHVIVQDDPNPDPQAELPQTTTQRSSHILTLSAKSETALTTLAERYVHHIATQNDLLKDICYTSNVGRTHLPYRLTTVATTSKQLHEQLQSFVSGKSQQRVQMQQTPSASPSIIWLFSGQGSQYVQMGRVLYETQPVFRATLDRCADILTSYLDTPLLELLYSDAVNETLIHETAYTQPILFAFEYALAEMWQSWGIVPTAVMGHSVGEYVAACVAGVFRLEDGLRLIVERGRLMQSLPKDGQMAVVFADEASVRSAIEPYKTTVAIAAINGPANITISGEHHAIETMVRHFEAEGITTRPLSTSHAFHSPLMDPITDAFEEVAKQIHFAAPRIPLVSNLTGAFLEAGYIPDAAYWRQHIREAVQFADSVQALQTLEQPLFIELGPTSSLISMGKRCADGAGTWLSTLKHKQDDWHILLQTLGKLYVSGSSVAWERVADGYPHYQRISLPTYPFERTSYWFKASEYQDNGKTHSVEVYTKGDTISMEKVVRASSSTSDVTIAPTSRLDTIRATVRSMLTRLLEMDQEALDAHASFLDIGADSIVLIHAIQSIQSTFGIDISVRQMFEGLNTLEAVAVYLDQQLPADAYVGEASVSPTDAVVDSIESTIPSDNTREPDSVTPIRTSTEHLNGQSSELERIMTQQLTSISSIITQQLEVLQTQSTITRKSHLSNSYTHTNGAHKNSDNTNVAHKNGVQNADTSHNGKAEEHPLSVKNELEAFVPYKAIDPGTSSELTPQQQTYLDTFIERYTARTITSKQQAQNDQQYHADLRNTMHFHLTTKELCYPLVAAHSLGSKIWDIDGNEYVDLTMGFGVNFFGHQEPFILEALSTQLQQGIQVGPQSHLAGEVAKLMCELTGAERVTFCNSGSEAVMTALRLARAATGRHKIAIFAGSYHGTFDGILATSQLVDGQPHTIPMAPGVTPHMVEDTLVIPFDSPQALQVLREHQHELAAVLVEPVQSRRPDLQPKAFLQEVRTLTQEAGIALIFDEVITGFRVHPGGAQAWYGIQADLATYGKVMGGGMPIGAVAGKAAFMNTVDGGEWSFNDQSYPRARTTFYSGTFCKHPLAMAAGHAVLQRIKESGPRLQEELNERVAHLAQTLNTYFEREQVPINVIHFGSLFRFAFAPQLTFSNVVNLWFYHLIQKGIYIWEGRNCIVSTAHTDSDYARIIDAVKQSVVELRAGGFLPAASDDPGPNHGPGSSSKTTETTTIPLTEAQQQLSMLTQMGGSASELVALSFQGSFDIDALYKAIQDVTNRHQALRIVIDRDNEHQHILAHQTVHFPIIDMSHSAGEEQDRQIEQWLAAESQHQFNLTQGPLVRWHVLKRSSEEYVLVLSAHHIVLDGWSIVVLLREVGQYYQAACKGQTVHFDPAMQWQEFIQQHADHLQRDQFQATEAYWLNLFADSVPLLDLPTDRPRPALKTYNGGRQSIRLGKVRRNDVKQLSQTFICTPFMTLVAVYMLQLHRLSGQNDLVIGFPTAGRPMKGSDDLLGYCSHLLVLRSQIQEDMDFASYLATVRTNLLTAYEHQDYPFASLINKLNLPRDPSRSPLVTVTFNLERPINVADIFGLDVDFMPTPLRYAAFDAHLNITEINDDLIVAFDYNVDLFDTTTIQRMLAQYQTLLDQVIDMPHQKLSRYTLVTPEDHMILPDPRIALPEPYYLPTPHAILEQAQHLPEQISIRHKTRTWTYAELTEQGTALTQVLLHTGVKPGDVVAIQGQRGFGLIVSMLAVMLSGGVILLLDQKLPTQRRQLMMDEAKANHMLFVDDTASAESPKNLVPETGTYCLIDMYSGICTTPAVGDSPTLIVPPAIKPDDPAYIFFTSGTTGKPKGVLGCHKGLSHFLTWQRQTFDVGPHDRAAQLTGLSFDVVLRDMLVPLTSGATLCFPDEDGNLNAEHILPWMEREHITLMHTVPTLAQSWLHSSPSDISLSHLRWVFFAGEPLTAQLVDNWRTAFPQSGQIANFYGPTETTLAKCCYIVPASPTPGVQPVGNPLPETQALVLNAEGQLCGVHETGEIVLRTPFCSLGYMNMPHEQERFVPNPFRDNLQDIVYFTGDMGRYRADGILQILGRQDDQVKIRGIRLELKEIVSVLEQHTDIQQSVVLTREDEDGTKRLVAYIVSQSTLTTSDLRGFLKKQLPDYMIPAAFVYIDAIPRTPNGKLDRRALPEPVFDRTELPETYVAPQTYVERVLADIWSQVLKIEPIGIHDDFFELGGDSILSIQVVARAAQTGVVLTPKVLFEHTTIAQVAPFCEMSQAGSVPEIVQHTEPLSMEAVLDDPAIEDAYPLAPLQLGMLFQEISTNRGADYLEQVIINIDEPLNQEAFTQAWQHVIARHAVLRTGFTWDSVDTPIQIVYRHVEAPINYTDLQHLSPSLQEQEVTQHIERLRRGSGFDITQPPLMDISVFQFGKQQFRCVWSNHHIILDGWAKSLILHEVYVYYRAFVANSIPKLAPNPRYQDYIDWLQRQDISLAEKHWKTILSDFTTPNLIGTHHSRERLTHDDIIYHQKTQTLSQTETTNLRDWARSNHLTLNALVQGAWSILLHRYTGDTDVVFGNVVSGRNAQIPGIESMVGLLINTLPVRTHMQPGTSGLEWVRMLQIQQVEALQYEFSPLMKVQAWSDIPSGDALFESVLVLGNYPDGHDDAWAIHNCSTQHTGYPLHAMVEPGTELHITLTGRGDRFDAASVVRLQGHLHHLLTQLVHQPDCPISQLALLTEAERHQLLVAWNATTTPFPLHQSFLTHFLAQAQRTPAAIAVADATTALSYADLAQRATHLAHLLRHHGLQPEDVVALLADRDTTFLVAFLAILLAGGTYLPLDPHHPPARWHQILTQSHTRLLLTTEPYASTLQTLQASQATQDPTACPGPPLLDLPSLLATPLPPAEPLPTLAPALRAYVLFTSGSTGQPKGAMLTHHGMLNHLFAKVHALNLQNTDVVAQTASQCFDISIWQFLAPLLVGAQVHILPDTIAHDPHALRAALSTYHISILETVPALLRALLETTTTPPPSVGPLRWLIPTGEALPPAVAQAWLTHYPHVPLMNAYGPTECSDDVTHAVLPTPQHVPDTTVPIGTPIANTQLYVLDAADMPLPLQVPGDLWVAGSGVGRGYLHAPARTAAVFRPDPFSPTPGARRYRTGDRARYRPDGQLEFLGRSDDQVKVRGFRIELGEIEAVLQQHPAVHTAVVHVWQETPDRDGRLVAYLVGRPGQDLPTVSTWRTYVGARLPEYMIPAAYVPLDTLPLTRNGKVDRRALPAPVLAGLDAGYVAPRTAVEDQLTRIWAEVLGLSQVGVHDNFFELGGNSLLATRFIARMPEHFHIDIPLRRLFSTPTVAGFAEAIEINTLPEDKVETASPNLQILDRGEKSLEDLLEEFQHLSEEEVLTLLAEMDETETKS